MIQKLTAALTTVLRYPYQEYKGSERTCERGMNRANPQLPQIMPKILQMKE